MTFVERFEPIVRTADDTLASLGLFNSYEEANDAAIMFASKNLPVETVKAYEIRKAYINVAFIE